MGGHHSVLIRDSLIYKQGQAGTLLLLSVVQYCFLGVSGIPACLLVAGSLCQGYLARGREVIGGNSDIRQFRLFCFLENSLWQISD